MIDPDVAERPQVLLVEDDAEIREQIKWALASSYTVLEAHDRATAVSIVRREAPPVVLLDLGLPPHSNTASEGLTALREILQLEPSTKVIVVTGNDERTVAHEAVQRGAWDYVQKPPDLRLLQTILTRGYQMATLEAEWRRTQQQTPGQETFCGIIGQSPAIRRVLDAVHRVASTNVSVLITGESGTGKELVARAIHALSPKAAQPFVPINCAAIPETLLESELFGYERGAFTGAERQMKGRLESAEGGTVLLDEVGEIPPTSQIKLLRFLQDRQLERVGSRAQIKMDLRILAATNTDLRAAIARGQLRQDLFYRLSVVEISVPPLRERGEDILLLARAFLGRYREELGKRVKGFSEHAHKSMLAHSWPGNVRELENRVKRAILMAEGPQITPADLELPWIETAQPSRKLRRLIEETERDLIQRALVAQGWNVSRAAVALDITRQTLHSMMKKYGLQKSK